METHAALPRRGHRTAFLLAFAIAFVVHLLLFCVSPMVGVLMGEMHLSHAQFGTVFSAAMVSLILFRLPWGLLADRRGYVGVLRAALALSASAAGLRAVSQGYAGLLVSQFLVGVGLAALMPCLSLMVKAWSPDRPGLGTGIYFSGFAVGNATALALTPVLLQMMSWRQAFLLYAAVAAVVCLGWFLLGRSGGVVSSSMRLGDIRLVLRERLVWVLLLLLVGSMGCYDTLAGWMPRVLQMKELEPGFASLLPAGFFAAGPVTGLVLDRFRSRRMLVALLGVMAAASIALIGSSSLPLLLLCLFTAGFATTGVSVVSLTMPVEQERLSPYAGTVVGFVTSASNVGPLAVPVLFGYLIDVTGFYYASLAAVAALAVVVFIGCSRLMR
jgi:CP family cyanate transporter-like MFS transporter